MRTHGETSPADSADFREFVVVGGCAVCEGPMTVRATTWSTRGCCTRCGWISHPLVWQGNGHFTVAYPPLASA